MAVGGALLTEISLTPFFILAILGVTDKEKAGIVPAWVFVIATLIGAAIAALLWKHVLKPSN